MREGKSKGNMEKGDEKYYRRVVCHPVDAADAFVGPG